MADKYSWVTGLASDVGRSLFCTALAKSFDDGSWQNREGVSQIALLSPEQFIVAIAANFATELLKAGWKRRSDLKNIKFRKIRFTRWRRSNSLKILSNPEKYWPMFLEEVDYAEFQNQLSNPDKLQQAMNNTWNAINEQGNYLHSLDFIRLVSRADIERIASSDFRERVIFCARDEVRVHFADDECHKKMIMDEINFLNTHRDMNNFLKEHSNDVISKALLTEEHWEPRYLNNNVSIFANLVLLKQAQLDNKGKLKVFFYSGNLADHGLPTLRATLIESKKGNSVFAGVMPRQATGMASSIISFDNHFEKARNELVQLRPREVDIDHKRTEISEIIIDLLMKVDYLTNQKKNQIVRIFHELNYSGTRNVTDDLAKVKEIQTIINQEYIKYQLD